MKNKFFTFVIAATAIVLVSLVFVPKLNNFHLQERPNNEEIIFKSALIVLNNGNNDIKTYSFEVNEETTAFSLLKQITEKENIPLETQKYDFGVFVKSINGMESNADKAWIYFVNNKSGTVAADQMKINPGDTVEWKYMTASE